jgi:hypothetical protein
MAIVHPAFCRYVGDSMEPIGVGEITIFHTVVADQDRGYKTFQKPRVQLKNR